MVFNGENGENGPNLSQFIAPAAALGGGYYLLTQGVLGSKEDEINHYKNVTKKAAKDFETEIEQQDSVKDSEIQTHIAEYKAQAKALNGQLDSGTVDIQAIEDELKGEAPADKALRWKQVTMMLSAENIAETAGENEFLRIMDEIAERIPWYDAMVKITILGGGVKLLSRLRNRGGGGGLMDDLRTVGDWVKAGIFGAKDYLEDIDLAPNPGEIPVGTPTTEPPTVPTTPPPTTMPWTQPDYNPDTPPSVTGTPRGAFDTLGIAESLASRLLTLAGVSATVTISLGADAVTAIASATGQGVDWVTNNPAKAIVIALAIVAAAALVVADGPLPFGDATAAGLLRTVAAALRVSMPSVGNIAKYAAPIAV